MQDATMRETNTRTIRRVVGPERWSSAAARQRFIASMQPVVGLHHPNLVRTDTLSERGDKVMIVTEAVNGVTLESILAADPVLSIAAVPSILAQVATALGQAHAAGIVHGALSSACVFIDVKGDAIVSDLGVAWALASAGAPGVDDDSAALAYASPEVVRGEHPSASSDQYAFGVLAYELLAGRRPFDGSGSKLRQAHLRRRPDPIDTPYYDFPEEWSQAVMRMLEKEPADRFASLAGAARAIAPADGALDQGFRGPLSWLVQEQLSSSTPRVSVPVTRAASAPPQHAPADTPADTPARAHVGAPVEPRAMASFMKELIDAAPHRGPRLAAASGGTRGRAIMAAAVVAIAVVAWYQLPSYTRARIWSTILFEKPLQWYSMPAESGSVVAPRALAGATPPPPTEVAPPAETAIVPPPRTVVSRPEQIAAAPPPLKERLPVERHERVTKPPARPRRSNERPPNSTAKTPDRIVVAPIILPSAPASSASSPDAPPPRAASPVAPPQTSTPVANAPPVTAPTTPHSTTAESSTTAHALSAADAAAAARTIVDQLRGTNVNALTLSMATSKMDRDFISWLSGRPVDLDIGAPPAPRVAETSDGGAQLSYVVPITWTHVSGARPTRAALLVVTVRPSASGAPLTSWSLAQPFVP